MERVDAASSAVSSVAELANKDQQSLPKELRELGRAQGSVANLNVGSMANKSLETQVRSTNNMATIN